MAKRFTDTDIWEQDWYIDLPNKYKFMWNYVKDKCDNVGIWRPNISILQKIVGEPLNINEFIQFINLDKERVKILSNGRWWVKDFFVFQYGNTFSPTSPVHKGALRQLVSNGVHPNEILGLDSGVLLSVDFQQVKEIAYDKSNDKIKKAFGIPINRDKDKDKDKDIKKGGMGENKIFAESFDEENFLAIFPDGSEQKLGKSQSFRFKNNDLKPKDIIKGEII